MKAVLSLVMSLVVSQAFAVDYQAQAEREFSKMTAQEAWSSDFTKQIFSFQMPGSSTWINPAYEACIDGTTMRTTRPISKCVGWTGKNKDGDRKTVYSLAEANRLFDGDYTCTKTTSAILTSPMYYQATVCTLWSAKGGDEDNYEVKYFSSKSQAENYGNHAVCARSEVVTKALPKSYVVKFYRNKIENDRYLGQHSYSIRFCADQ